MALFKNPFFKSADDGVEAAYTEGVKSLQAGNFYAADKHLRIAALGGHVSALHNLSIIHGCGLISPYDLDVAADCWYKAAEGGHPTAKSTLPLLEGADRGGLGYDNLAAFAAQNTLPGQLVGTVMICACRFTDVLCKKYGATNDVIAYEIDAARQSDLRAVEKFVARTGIPADQSAGGLDRLIEGSAADQITDGLNQFSVALQRAGLKTELVMMSRCTVIGYVVAKSVYGSRSQPLLGVDKFFS